MKFPMRLLVSIRSVHEAKIALAGNADLIDIKEPLQGPLGAASPEVWEAVATEIGSLRPLSAALGEWTHRPPHPFSNPSNPGNKVSSWYASLKGFTFVKWGLAQAAGQDWQSDWMHQQSQLPAGIHLVPTAYADSQKANSPNIQEVAHFAQEQKSRAFLIDTYCKDGSNLLDWVSLHELGSLVRHLQGFQIEVALAGSLNRLAIEALREIRPNWVAVRGAVCEGGRAGTISQAKVQELADFVHKS